MTPLCLLIYERVRLLRIQGRRLQSLRNLRRGQHGTGKDSRVMTFTIDGAPTGKARPRVTRFGTHNTETTTLYENLVKISYKQQCKEFFEGSLIVTIIACFDVPKSTSKKQREQMLDGHIFPTKKPDIDNIAKIILDALNGTAYKDDTQVIWLTVRKKYEERAHVDVNIQRFGEII